MRNIKFKMNGNVDKITKTDSKVCDNKNFILDKNSINLSENKNGNKDYLKCKKIKSVIPKHRYLFL